MIASLYVTHAYRIKNMYVKPTDVLSPRGHVEVLDVLYDAGEWDVSVARINYRDELNQPFSECTGIR